MPSSPLPVHPETVPLTAISSKSQESTVRNSNGDSLQPENGLTTCAQTANEDEELKSQTTAVEESGGNASRELLINCNSSLDDQLVKAIKEGDDIMKIKSLLQAKASPNAVDHSSRLSCTQIATKACRADVLHLLFQHNADPKVAEDGKTLLHLAVEMKDINCLKVIVQTDVDINQVDIEKKETALNAAINGEWLDGVRELLNYQPNMEKRYGKSNKTALMNAVGTKNTDLVSLIVNRARSYDNFSEIINAFNHQNMSPLFIGVLENNLELVEIFLNANANVLLLDKWNRNVLHCAAEKGNFEIMEELYRQKPDEMAVLAEQTCEGKLKGTPLHIAISRGSDKCVKYLIEKANVSISYKANVAGHKNCNLLHIASDSDKPEVIKYFTSLLNNRHALSKQVYEATDFGETPLHFSLKRRQIEFIYALIAAGSDLTAKCNDKNNCSRSALNILIHQVPSAVDIINNVFDKSIQKKKKSTSVEVDYKVLMPQMEKESENKLDQSEKGQASGSNAVFKGDSFGVLKALQKTGDRRGQKKLLEHPLVESFVHLHWKRLEGPYFVLVVLNILYALFLSLFALLKLTLNNDETQWALGTFMIIFLVPLIIHEFECLKEQQPWGYRIESFLKLICFALSILICFPIFSDVIAFPAFAVLLTWFEVVLLISRIPYYGHYMLMFIEIAFKYLKLLSSFIFVLFGFVVAFMIIFELREPFTSFWPSIVKIIVMLTNELEYDDFNTKFNKENQTTFRKILAMGVFTLFVVFISLVLTNLFVAVAVNDINKLHLISKQASFLSVYDAFLLPKPSQDTSRGTIRLLFCVVCVVVRLFVPKLVKKWEHFGEVKSKYEIDVLIEEEVVRFPEELSSALIEKGYENRDKILKEYREKEDKLKDIDAAEKANLEERKCLVRDLEALICTFENKMNIKLNSLADQISEINASNVYRNRIE